MFAGFIELCDAFPSIRWRLFARDVNDEGAAVHNFCAAIR
jgi:hypothetical protein